MKQVLYILTLCLLSLTASCSDNTTPYKAQESIDKMTSSVPMFLSSNGKECTLMVELEEGRRSFYLRTEYGIGQQNKDCLALKKQEKIQILQRGDNYFWRVGDHLIPLN